jgi:hypothetical protein
MAYKKILFRRDPAASWTSENPVLSAGEVGLETDTGKIKIGNGSSTWTALSYFVGNLPGATLDALGDVTITSAANGDFLRWNGTAWINDAVNLSTDTVGNYVESLVAGTGVTLTNNSGEGSTPTVAVDTTVIQARVSGVTDTEIGYLDGVTWAIQTQLDAKAPSASPVFTGLVILPANTVSQVHLNDDSVGTNEIIGLSVTTAKLADGSVTSGKIADGAIVDADINASASIAMSKISGLDTALSAKAPIASPTFTGTVTLANDPSSALHAATKQYVDNISSGINFHESVVAATTGNLAGTYDNGTSGAGATITKATNGAIGTIDGASVVVGSRILLKAQTDSKENGIYTVTDVGSVSAPWVVTRATDADNNPAGEMKTGDFCFVTGGSTNAGFGFVNNSATNPIAIGTDNITYTPFNAAQTLTNGSGINLVSNVLSVDTTVIQARVADVSDTEIGYLNGTTSAIQTQLNAKAPLSSPDLTGTPTAPTATSGTNTTQIATTAFVKTAVDGAAITSLGVIGDVAITSAASGDILKWSGTQWVNDSALLAAKANSASPTFTGVVTLPDNTVALGTKTTGDYVASLVAGTGVTLTNNSGETATPTIAIGQAVGTSSSVQFAAVTAPLIGNASTATTLQTARNIAGQPFNGSADISIAPTDLTGVTATATELNYVDGVTSSIQTQLDNKASATASPVITLGGDLSGSATFTNLGNATLTATIASNSVALGADTSGDYVSVITAGTGVTVTGGTGETSTPTIAIGQSVATSASVTFSQVETTGNLIVGGDLSVHGTLTTINETNLAIEDTFIYLNDGSTITNPDLGWVGNYNDGTYRHAGLFRDATDGKFKFFDSYEIEPADPINTAHASYSAAPVVAEVFESTVATGTAPLSVSSSTVVTNLNADLLDGQSGSFYAPVNNASFTGTFSAPSGTITSTMIADGTIVNADIDSSAAIALSKLATSTAGNIIVYNSSGVPTSVAETGDVTISDTGVTSIASGVIVNADISASAEIDLGKLADVSTNAQPSYYTLVLADKNKIVEMGDSGAHTLTVPPNSSVAFPVGSQINILQTGVGRTTVTAGAGVTINASPGLKLRAQWSYATLIKRATDTWVLVGDVSA